MPNKRLAEYLEQHHIQFTTRKHPITYTASRTAAITHTRGKEFAKTVVLRVDGKPLMAVIPANTHIDLKRVKEMTGSNDVRLANERENGFFFDDCWNGAMPPFGNLYRMDVIADETLHADREIAFNAGNHQEIVRMAMTDYERLVHPKFGHILTH